MKKLLTILVLITLIISIFQISSMYALYKSQILGNYETELGIWNIKINNEEITSKEFRKFENKLTLKAIDTEKVEEGKIAPESEFFIELNIDPMKTDVSIIYKVQCGDISKNNNENNVKLKIKKIVNTFENGEEIIANDKSVLKEDEASNYCVGVIPKEMINNNYKNKLVIYLKWESEDEVDKNLGEFKESMVDAENQTVTNEQLTVPIKINLKQYIGEEINDI